VVAEQSLHRFFSTMGSPYRAFQADSPTALARGDRPGGSLENAPLEYAEVRPRREFETAVFWWRSGGSAAAGSRATLGACRMNWRAQIG